jgi:hypothetical protein
VAPVYAASVGMPDVARSAKWDGRFPGMASKVFGLGIVGAGLCATVGVEAMRALPITPVNSYRVEGQKQSIPRNRLNRRAFCFCGPSLAVAVVLKRILRVERLIRTVIYFFHKHDP